MHRIVVVVERQTAWTDVDTRRDPAIAVPRTAWRLALAALVSLAIGCASAHEARDDAGIADASAHDAGADAPATDAGPRDTGAPDSPPCADADGDGYADARCGGDDCDDADWELSPSAGPCAGPTRAIRCVGGVVMEIDCPLDAPDCDARTNECAPSACGDGVTHPDEECDDLNTSERDGCDTSCHFSRCGHTAHCMYDAALRCVPIEGEPIGQCQLEHVGGAPMGSPCTASDDCAAYCDPYQNRCTEACFANADCPGPNTFCSMWGFVIAGGAVSPPLMTRCERECRAQADCPEGSSCTVVHVQGPGIIAATCRPIYGTSMVGQPCGSGCTTNTCLRSAGRCTTVCTDDADCVPELPRCAPYPTSDDFTPPMPRPPEWGPEVRVCQPPV